jgi:hypothetical protein
LLGPAETVLFVGKARHGVVGQAEVVADFVDEDVTQDSGNGKPSPLRIVEDRTSKEEYHRGLWPSHIRQARSQRCTLIKTKELVWLRHTELFQRLGFRLLRKNEHDIAGEGTKFLWQCHKFCPRHTLQVI